ncbi:hypothetical protein [Nostoc sp. KVJ20]|uniref:hypothetical protein n=1 Tax=Nostoc sp. KVJ20 TaxID=457944 RepID=UPI00114C94E6|nr:hypothetical protein [Nostoc sp. KVJ20]
MSKYPFFIHSLLLTHYFKAVLETRGFKPIFLIITFIMMSDRLTQSLFVPVYLVVRQVNLAG